MTESDFNAALDSHGLLEVVNSTSADYIMRIGRAVLKTMYLSQLTKQKHGLTLYEGRSVVRIEVEATTSGQPEEGGV